ncbi:hypothetical protein ACFE04_013908 [Oxalis oulophora]
MLAMTDLFRMIICRNFLPLSLTNMATKLCVREKRTRSTDAIVRRFSIETSKQSMAVQHFSVEIDFHMLKNMRLVEFNKAAQSLAEATLLSGTSRKLALNRLVKDNVALIVVLEAKFGYQGVDNPVSQKTRQLL